MINSVELCCANNKIRLRMNSLCRSQTLLSRILQVRATAWQVGRWYHRSCCWWWDNVSNTLSSTCMLFFSVTNDTSLLLRACRFNFAVLYCINYRGIRIGWNLHKNSEIPDQLIHSLTYLALIMGSVLPLVKCNVQMATVCKINWCG